ncbi:glutaredoxin family protein [Bifidobacterium myosotis]|uniref:Glutaredoxin family protein n=2 Tax=Bifidobacterium myosotis TaxID=1630166 RepID=A0A5M9ZG71_9BIFI|nr:glutaredoxin family protein [Bifidobacterium myosotis]
MAFASLFILCSAAPPRGSNTMTVTVFTKPHCPQCEATKRQFTKLGVPFETVDLEQNPSTLEQLQAAGFRQAPVVITPDNSWAGYRPDLIREVAKQAAASAAVPAAVAA